MKDKYKILIRSTWAVLIFYCIIKVLFGVCFDLMSESKNFIMITQYIDNHLWLKKIVACITTLISGYFIICAITKQKYLKWYHLIVFVPLTIIVFTILFAIMPSKNQFVFGSIIVMYVLTLVSYYVKDYLDIKFPSKKKRDTNRKTIIDILGKDNLNEEYIEEYCNKLGLINISETIYLFLNNTIEETSEILEVDNTTITRRINKFIKESRK